VAEPQSRLTHHDLCFGCGQANLFGLQLELERRPEGGVAGRFFVKQDHQGPPGYAHGGVIAAALDEAMSLVLHGQGTFALTGGLEVELLEPVPVGSFVAVEADVEEADGRALRLTATARDPEDEARTYATARGRFVEARAEG
jgi:acyl-coenzyme A thioesterase PaaI-like protein